MFPSEKKGLDIKHHYYNLFQFKHALEKPCTLVRPFTLQRGR